MTKYFYSSNFEHTDSRIPQVTPLQPCSVAIHTVEGDIATRTIEISTNCPVLVATITNQIEGAVIEHPYLVTLGEA